MKPFSKMDAIGFGKPVVTRDGRKITQLVEILSDIAYPIVGLIKGEIQISTWTSDGVYEKRNSSSNNDLFMESIKKDGWINLHETTADHLVAETGYPYPTHVFKTKKDADEHAKTFPRIACVHIEWEE